MLYINTDLECLIGSSYKERHYTDPAIASNIIRNKIHKLACKLISVNENSGFKINNKIP